jgi:ubiquinone/menaquinone biosynthesis C-methylase UbiE
VVPKEFKPSITSPVYLIRRFLYQSIAEHSKKLTGKLLDVGCGVKPYESLFTVDEYIGMDYNGEGETYSKEKADFLYDGKHIPFEDSSFDSVFSSEVFEHVFNPDELVQEIYRVLKPRGVALITCPFSFPEHEAPNDYCRYSSFAIQDLFVRNGFSVVEYQKTGDSILARAQLSSIYWNNYILSKIQSIPVLRTVVRKVFFFLHHNIAIFKSKILPESKELYLSNILIVKKGA